MPETLPFPKKQAFRDFSVLVFLLGLLTLIFRFTNLDITLEHYFYSSDKGWILQYKPVWDFIYRFGIFPGYFLAFSGLIMISASYWNRKYIRFRKISLLLVFTIIVGPGILVNLVLKDHSGRPRPREITEFGGTENYLCICEKGKTNEGKSFPCGHCSMGFYLAIPYLFYRNRKKALAYTFLATGITYGILIGIARMMAGGHFASDVIWAGALTWGVALGGYYLFRLYSPDRITDIPEIEQKKKARRVTLIIGILLPVITVGLMLATPYISKKYIDVTSLQLKAAHCRAVDIDLKDATVILGSGKEFHLDYKVNAFGFPNSKIRGLWTSGDTSRYIIQHLGWFTEVKNMVNLQLPLQDSLTWLIHINQGKVICNFQGNFRSEIHFFIEKGDLLIHPGTGSVSLVGDPAKVIDKKLLKTPCFLRKPMTTQGALILFDLKEGAVVID